MKSMYPESEFHELALGDVAATWNPEKVYAILHNGRVDENLTRGFGVHRSDVELDVWWRGSLRPCTLHYANVQCDTLVVSFDSGEDAVMTVLFLRQLIGGRLEWVLATHALVLPDRDPRRWKEGDSEKPSHHRSSRVLEFMSQVHEHQAISNTPFRPMEPPGATE